MAVLRQLLAHDPTTAVAADAQQLRPLHLACLKGHTECVRALVDAAPETLDMPDVHGRTALMLAASSAAPDELLKLLAERGAAVNATSSDGKTALHWAVISHQPQAQPIARLLAQITRKSVWPSDSFSLPVPLHI